MDTLDNDVFNDIHVSILDVHTRHGRRIEELASLVMQDDTHKLAKFLQEWFLERRNDDRILKSADGVKVGSSNRV
jgi:hypothetical protein